MILILVGLFFPFELFYPVFEFAGLIEERYLLFDKIADPYL